MGTTRQVFSESPELIGPIDKDTFKLVGSVIKYHTISYHIIVEQYNASKLQRKEKGKEENDI